MSFLIVAAAVGVAAGASKIIMANQGRKGRIAEQAAAKQEMEKNKAAYENLDTSNAYANLENKFEDITVNKQQANFEAQQSALEGEYQQMIQEYLKWKNTLNYYEIAQLPQSRLIAQQSQKAFKAGEIGYFEHSQNLMQVLQIQSTTCVKLLPVPALNLRELQKFACFATPHTAHKTTV